VKVLFLSVDFPLPADRGLRVRTLTQLRLLHGLEAVSEITLLSLRNATVESSRITELGELLPGMRIEPPIFQPIHMRQHPETLPRLLTLRFLRDVPYIVGKCDNPIMRRLVREHLTTGTYDVVYLGSLGMATYLADILALAPRARVILEQHNVEWEIFDRLADSYGPRMRAVVKWEARCVKRYEARTLPKVDQVLAISEVDAHEFQKLSGTSATVVPPFITPRPARAERATTPSLVYVGVLGWQPNVQGLDWFCREVWPLILQQEPHATLRIVGGGLPRTDAGDPIMPEHWRLTGISAAGFVEHLDAVYDASLALIAPIIGGSGVRMKLLEAFSAGMPTISTPDGAAGLPVQDGRELMIGQTPADFASRVIAVLRDAELRATLRTAAWRYLRAHHSEAIGRERLGSALLSGRTSSAHASTH
jgi:polysaccharide biosynthesis protein PslH